MKHTELPWKHTSTVGGWDSVSGPTGEIICTLVANNPINAEFIVRACNSHDDLLEALESLLRCSEYKATDYCGTCVPAAEEAIQKAKQ